MRATILARIFAVLMCIHLWAEGAQATAYDLDTVELMEGFVGAPGAKELLACQGFVVTDQQFKQIFQAYIGGALPKFVTTDSAWHTYHVLLEEGVRALETSQAGRLKEFSARLVSTALARSASDNDVYKDLARFAAVGLALQDESAVESMDENLRTEVEEVLAALGTGGGAVKVLFFGLPVMSERLRPGSFYGESERLRSYFAARQWYALCDFRAKSKEETARAVRLALMIESDQRLKELHQSLTLPYDALLGPCEDGDVRTYASMAREVFGEEPTENDLEEKMDAFCRALSDLPDPLVNDQWLLPEEYQNFAEETKGFRLLPPRRLPSAVLFQNTVDPLVKGRMFPSGVDFFAVGPLASEAGRRALHAAVADDQVAEDILAARTSSLPDSLHGQGLRLLTLLQEPLPETAPEPLLTPAWQDKQLWTQLGAWAEQRHTWALHTKLTAHYLGLTMENPGMVSAYPEFFSGLGQLAGATAEVLSQHTGEQLIDTRGTGQELLELLKLVDRLMEGKESRSEELAERVAAFEGFLEAYFEKNPPESRAAFEKAMKGLQELAEECAGGGTPTEEEIGVLRLFRNPTDVASLLSDFAGLCDSLAAIARKELAGEPLSGDDANLIRSYGKTLARFHFYGGNSWLEPRDDFPLVTPIFVSPIKQEVLYAGLPRPEALYVIAEINGGNVLHRGAVLSYREFRRPELRPLDDDAWQEQVRKGAVPEPPVFTESFRKTITEDEVVEIIRSGGVYAAVDSVPGPRVTRAMVEVLLSGSSEHEAWLRERLCDRAGKDDVGDLLRVLQKTDPEEIAELAFCINDLPWRKHGTELLELVRHSVNEYADAATYILSRRPEEIDVGALVTGFGEQPPRTKRLYCFLLGYVAERDAEAARILEKALADEHARVRYQAACAIARAHLKQASTVEALLARLEDANPYVAQAAAFALRALGAKDAAPAMLARLKKGVRGGDFIDDSTDAQGEAVFGGTKYSGCPLLMVLSWPPGLGMPRGRGGRVSFGRTPTPPSVELGRELIKGLGAFRYAPAQPTLEALLEGERRVLALSALKEIDPDGHRERASQMLDGPYVMEAIRALEEVDPGGHLQRLLAAALKPSAPVFRKQWALEKIDSRGKPEDALRLLPLLEDTTEVGLSVAGEEWRLCDFAAQAIATLLGWEQNISWMDGSDRQAKEALMARIRGWAEAEER